MPKSRRTFLQTSSIGLLAGAGVCASADQNPAPPAGAPTAFNTSPPVGPEVSAATFAEAEKLVQVTLTDGQRAMAAESWRTSMASLYERRTGPRKVKLEATLAPGTQWNPELPEVRTVPLANRFVRSQHEAKPLPGDDASIAYAPVTQLSGWIEKRELTSSG